MSSQAKIVPSSRYAAPVNVLLRLMSASANCKYSRLHVVDEKKAEPSCRRVIVNQHDSKGSSFCTLARTLLRVGVVAIVTRPLHILLNATCVVVAVQSVSR